MPRRIAAETSSSSASTSSAIGAPTSRISAPARPGPATSAPDEASAFFACASTRRSRVTTCISTICAARAGGRVDRADDEADDVQPGHRQPAHQPGERHAGDDEGERASRRATYTGSLRTRSSQTPEGSENSTNGTISTPVSSAHLRRARVQQHRRGQRQREQRHLAAERADQDRRPQAAVGRLAQQVAGGQQRIGGAARTSP